jgi:hypothetical protein
MTLLLRFTRSGTDHSFTTTAESAVISNDRIEDSWTGKLVARIKREYIGDQLQTVYIPGLNQNRHWYDGLEITPTGDLT